MDNGNKEIIIGNGLSSVASKEKYVLYSTIDKHGVRRVFSTEKSAADYQKYSLDACVGSPIVKYDFVAPDDLIVPLCGHIPYCDYTKNADTEPINIYVDGSGITQNNMRCLGIGIFMEYKDHMTEFGTTIFDADKVLGGETAEIIAVILGLKIAIRAGYRRINLCYDSEMLRYTLDPFIASGLIRLSERTISGTTKCDREITNLFNDGGIECDILKPSSMRDAEDASYYAYEYSLPVKQYISFIEMILDQIPDLQLTMVHTKAHSYIIGNEHANQIAWLHAQAGHDYLCCPKCWYSHGAISGKIYRYNKQYCENIDISDYSSHLMFVCEKYGITDCEKELIRGMMCGCSDKTLRKYYGITRATFYTLKQTIIDKLSLFSTLNTEENLFISELIDVVYNDGRHKHFRIKDSGYRKIESYGQEFLRRYFQYSTYSHAAIEIENNLIEKFNRQFELFCYTNISNPLSMTPGRFAHALCNMSETLQLRPSEEMYIVSILYDDESHMMHHQFGYNAKRTKNIRRVVFEKIGMSDHLEENNNDTSAVIQEIMALISSY